jgi:tetratricopeptide (TPR) repeat protein
MEPQAIRDQLERILVSQEFAGVPRLQRFLSFVVETSLGGRSAEIKETLVAIEVYGRPPDYDPQMDASVRVEAGRLRARLRRYYDGSGRGDGIEISLPRGTYAPSFERRRLPLADIATGATSVQISDGGPAPALRLFLRQRLKAMVGVAAAIVLLCAGFGARWFSRTSSPSRTAHASTDPASLELYFRACQLLKQPKYSLSVDGPVPDGVLESVRLLEEVTHRNPRFAKGWVSLAEANEFAWELDKARPAKRLKAAKAAVDRAIEIDPNLPEAWTLAASLHFYREFDLAAAQAACRRAIELNPRDTLAHRRYLDLLRIQGRVNEGLSHVTNAMALDPLSVTLRVLRSMLLYDSGRFHEAAEEASRAAALNSTRQQPLYSMAMWVRGASEQHMGRSEKAEMLFRAALEYEPNDTWNGPSLGYLLAITGRRAEATAIAEGLSRRLRDGKGLHSQLALVYAGLGRDAEAIQLLEEGYRTREPGVLFARIEKRFERLRYDSRFVAFLNQIERTYRPAST